MFTPVLNPNSSTSTNANTNSNPSVSQIHIQLSKILRQHDPNAIRLYDFINHVKVFLYNTTSFQWENNSYIEGNLFAYGRQEIRNNQAYPSYAFAIINEKQNFIQKITMDMSHQADKLRLFYEVVKNDKKPEVFCLHFLNENECLRLNAFIKNIKEHQIRLTATSALQHTQTNEQIIPMNANRQQTPTLKSSRPPSTPITNSNNTEDPTLSLKRLLNIPNQNGLDLLPPAAFESQPATPPSPIGAERSKNRLSQSNATLSREHFRHILLDLVQNNDDFLDIIHQACVTYSSQ